MPRIDRQATVPELTHVSGHSYVPKIVADWPSDVPENAQEALDDLAGRVDPSLDDDELCWIDSGQYVATYVPYLYSNAGVGVEMRVSALAVDGGNLRVFSNLRLYFRDAGLYIYSSADGQLNLVADTKATVTGAANSDIVLGEAANHTAVRPQTNDMTSLGTSSHRWEGVYSSDVVDAQGGLVTKCSDYNGSAPPTDADLDAAFGTPAVLGDGWMGVYDDNGDGTDVYLCLVKNSTWWHVALTAAV